ncbi:hypothetical protein [Streptomyces griseorubiginosus]|uniref:hypothetical protein n=1 Tax=Streptomyces griseorubiginosus TaxID=67304 RepID=UPI001AD668A6|nr:hypothetical protein [Streptomyces griseorubiginosus]MBO4258014.1 hypothetical protein [Streptomyces griseorubiginosus]
MRANVVFATGLAPRVAGLRSFRDTERRDIEAELTGWPPAPGFTPRGKADQAGVRALDIALLGIPRLINMIGNIHVPSGRLVDEPGSPGKPQEPENEVDDFPVMWAAEGTIARTLPWQLDPARQPRKYRTELVLTDRRLIILGVDASAGLAPADELWQVPRASVTAIDQMAYPANGSDVRVRFTDGSWTRWKVGNAAKLVGQFRGERERVTEAALTPQQRERVAELVADPPLSVARSVGTVLPVTEPPSLDRFSDGTVAVELQVPLSNGTLQVLTRYLSPSGKDVMPKEETK